MSKYATPVYTILRIVVGLLFLWHGSQKIFDFPPSGYPMTSFIVIFGGLIEFIGGLFVMIGLFTPWAAFICSGEMAYAYWAFHGTHALLPLQNGGEMAMLYCFVFFFIAASGSGVFSIDHFLEKRRQNLNK